jgi:hypothetical protein
MAKEISKLNDSRIELAYQVETGDPEESSIQFATTNVAARRQGAHAADVDFTQASCKRAHWADQYAGQRCIPAQAYIENGWNIGCTNCAVTVSSDSYHQDEDGDTDKPHEPVYRGEDLFCSAECELLHDAEVASYNAKGEAFKARVTQERPDLEFTVFRCGWPHITMVGEFKFPGCQYGGSVRDQEGDGTIQWYVAGGDVTAWLAYEKEGQATVHQAKAKYNWKHDWAESAQAVRPRDRLPRGVKRAPLTKPYGLITDEMPLYARS